MFLLPIVMSVFFKKTHLHLHNIVDIRLFVNKLNVLSYTDPLENKIFLGE